MVSARLYDDVLSTVPGSVAEHRQRVQRAVKEREALRDSELEAQASPVKEPQERIGIWERLHALRLPRSSGHVLVRVIARQTKLTVGQIHEEQQRRASVELQSRSSPAPTDEVAKPE